SDLLPRACLPRLGLHALPQKLILRLLLLKAAAELESLRQRLPETARLRQAGGEKPETEVEDRICQKALEILRAGPEQPGRLYCSAVRHDSPSPEQAAKQADTGPEARPEGRPDARHQAPQLRARQRTTEAARKSPGERTAARLRHHLPHGGPERHGRAR